MDRADLQTWVARYEEAWREPGTERLREVFADDAKYSTGPFEKPHRGLDAIAEMWEQERSPDEEFTVATEVVAVEGDIGVVRVEVSYERPRRQRYRDLWIVRLDRAGRCTDFEEWPCWPPGSGGTVAPGASK